MAEGIFSQFTERLEQAKEEGRKAGQKLEEGAAVAAQEAEKKSEARTRSALVTAGFVAAVAAVGYWVWKRG